MRLPGDPEIDKLGFWEARIKVHSYQTLTGGVPVVEWLRKLRKPEADAYHKCVARIARLAELGHELRRPEADFLRDGIYELRIRRRRVNYRVLYFFYGKDAVLIQGLTKEGKIPPGEIDRAVARKRAFELNPKQHTLRLTLRERR